MQKLQALECIEVLPFPGTHDTWTLLRKYRDVVWSLELSVRRAQKKFEVEYDKSNESSFQMLKLVDSAVSLLRAKHKHGEPYYWILCDSFLSSQEYKNAEEIVNLLRAHITDINYRTYYRRRRDAVEASSSIPWGYTSKEVSGLLKMFFPVQNECR